MRIFSEAMRRGAALHPQTFGRVYLHRFNDRTGHMDVSASCALGAIVQGGLTDLTYLETTMDEVCPVCRIPRWSLEDVITHLNDNHRWTREAIADWLETVEPEEPEPLAATVVAEEELVLV